MFSEKMRALKKTVIVITVSGKPFRRGVFGPVDVPDADVALVLIACQMVMEIERIAFKRFFLCTDMEADFILPAVFVVNVENFLGVVAGRFFRNRQITQSVFAVRG